MDNIDALELIVGLAVSVVGIGSGVVALIVGWRGLSRRRRLLSEAFDLDVAARSIGDELAQERIAHARDIAFWQWSALCATRGSLLQAAGPVLALVEGIAFLVLGFTRDPGVPALLLVLSGVFLVYLPPTMLEAGRHKRDRAARAHLEAQAAGLAHEAARAAELNRAMFLPTWRLTVGVFVMTMVGAGSLLSMADEHAAAGCAAAVMGVGVILLEVVRRETVVSSEP